MNHPSLALIVSGGGVAIDDDLVKGALEALNARYPIGRLITARDTARASVGRARSDSDGSASAAAEAWARWRDIPVSYWAREIRGRADPRLEGERRHALYWRVVTRCGANAVLHFPGIEYEVPMLASRARLRVWRVDPKTRALLPGP